MTTNEMMGYEGGEALAGGLDLAKLKKCTGIVIALEMLLDH